MGALSADRNTKLRDGDKIVIPAAVDICYAGGAVAWNASGYGAPAADSSGYVFAGICEEQCDNSDGDAGDVNVKVRRDQCGLWASSGLSQADEGQDCWFSDDQTVIRTAGNCYAGKIIEVVSATLAWVDHAPAYAARPGRAHTHVSDAQGSVLNPYTALSQARQGVAIAVTGAGGGLAAANLVYFSDVSSAVPVASKAQGTAGGKFACAIVPAAIEAEATGKAVTEYMLTGVNTDAGSVGDPVYLSDASAGAWTLTKPTATDKVQIVGRVTVKDASDGEIFFSLPGTIQVVHTHVSNAEGGTLGQAIDGTTPKDVADGGHAVPLVIQKTFGDMATGDVEIYNENAPFKFRVIDAWVENRAANGANANSVQVCAAAAGASTITDAMSLNNVADTDIVRAGEVDDSDGTIAAGGSLYLRVTKAGGTMGGNVYILAVRVA